MLKHKFIEKLSFRKIGNLNYNIIVYSYIVLQFNNKIIFNYHRSLKIYLDKFVKITQLLLM